jgi:hypothetical protein
MTSGVGLQSLGENLRRKQVMRQYEKPKPLANHLSMQFDTTKLNYIYGVTRENVHSKELDPDESQCSGNVQAVQGEINLAQTEGCPKSMPKITHMQSDYKVS